tara:strand:- start:3244 stop:3885 length:642 start_codon:yes stop_codon:yes gene_type:complete
MKFCTIIVTRGKSCHVKTLHSVLRFNLLCLQSKSENELIFVDEEPYEKSEMIQSKMKTCDRIFYIDYGISVDDDSLKKCFGPNDGIGCLVFPGVKEGIDWEMFKHKVKNDVKEPIQQMGMHFDTSVGRKITEDIYVVDETSAKCWVMMNKNVLKHVKDKKSGSFKIYPRMNVMFSKLRESGVKIHAYVEAKLTMTYAHECVSNILHSSGIKSN